ncbi:uncharacterized protein LOC117181279 [Belonocnema kinseyi]|uniref:uncharacterized protein LOC117181279 n=1 Tax=Belonocnema kinseyi TaxID=2817044 RepID=UPI00143DC52B|nr:uncharacterized protein LOC117181279 [Belonocnema kinseyi]
MDVGLSSAEFFYGTTLRIPGEFVLPDDFRPNLQIFLEEFREHMRSMKSVPVGHHGNKRAFLHKDLNSCSHVFVRVGPGKKSLERPYTGPHKVVMRTSDRVFGIEVNGSSRQVSVENLKPAYFLRNDIVNLATTNSKEKTATNVVPVQ